MLARRTACGEMSSNQLLRFRRSAAQLHALAEVERTIRATDTKSRRKYLRDFNEAFRTYRRVLPFGELESQLSHYDLILVGDYHALPASQRFTAELVRRLAATGRTIVLGVEAIVARDQHILDEWQRGEIDAHELCSRIRFETDWGYDWQPFRELLETARALGVPIFGLDCTPRQDMRSIRARDQHAAAKICELRQAYPAAQLVVLFGESHLAPTHLPMRVRDLRPGDEILTALQNVDTLYWLSAGEPEDLVEAVEIRDDVVCVFSATPLEKYEHYRLCIERWKRTRVGTLDLAPCFYNLIGSLSRFLNVNLYDTGGRFLVDELPEVWSVTGEEQLDRLLARRMSTRAAEVRAMVDQQGSWFVSERNVIIAREFRMPWAAEQASRFVHRACRGAASKCPMPEDAFYGQLLETALAFLGSKILCPSRKLCDEVHLRAQRVKPEQQLPPTVSMRTFRQVLDSILHGRAKGTDPLDPSLFLDSDRREIAIRILGQLLGSDLYRGYVNGRISKRYLRALFFRDLSKSGDARSLYLRATSTAAMGAPRITLEMVS
jgi:hypothetical protein